VKDRSNRLIINVKMINLNRQTLPLYIRKRRHYYRRIFISTFNLQWTINQSINQILEKTNEIEDKKREAVKQIITEIVLNFINLNPEYIYTIKDN